MTKANLKSHMEVDDEERELLLKLRKEKARKEFQPKACGDIDDQIKIAGFNKLYGMALSIIEEGMQAGYINDDVGNWCYEAVMELLDPKIFDRLQEMKLSQM
jgi:hypothetical protein